MNNKFDELTKQMAQSVTRRQAFKKFGVGLAGMALACFGLANRAEAHTCTTNSDCSNGDVCLGGRCFPKPCSSTSDCPKQMICWFGRCIKPGSKFGF